MAQKKKRKNGRKKKKKVNGWWLVIAALCILIIPPIISHIRLGSWGKIETGAIIPKVMNQGFAIDLSHHNAKNINWSGLKVMTDQHGRTVRSHEKATDSQPVRYVFLKATEGVNMKDKTFRRRWEEAGEAGLRRGAYHFFNPSRDGLSQAENFIETIPEIPYLDLPPVLDIETIHRRCPRSLLNSRVREFLSAIEKHYGRRPIIYTYDSFLKDYLDSDITQTYEIWIAHYETDSPDYNGWTWWQFTDRAIVHGIPGFVDLSIHR